ncbi:MAG: hypothetical protein ABSA96_13255 [Candidatus Acidiferrales bacterium]|jgi:hypothetical protein
MSETATALATTEEEKMDINVHFLSDDPAVIASISDTDIVGIINGEVDGFITETDIRFRKFSLRLRPYFAEFHNRYRAEKRAGRAYLGFKDYDRLCEAKLHYSGKQARRIENGEPTPPKKPVLNPVSPERLAFLKKQREDQAIADAAVEAAFEARERANKENLAGQAAVIADTAPVVPNPVRSVVVVDAVAKRTRLLLDEAVAIINLFLAEKQTARKTAIAFLNKNFGGQEELTDDTPADAQEEVAQPIEEEKPAPAESQKDLMKRRNSTQG